MAEDGGAFREVSSGLQFPEGPIALDDGSVLLVEIQRGTLSRVGTDGTVSVVADCGGGPNGAAVGPDGAVYVCNNGGFEWHERDGMTAPGHQPADYLGGRIQRVTLDGAVTDLYTSVDGRPLRGPNDIVFDAEGGFYFTDLGKSRDRESDTGGLYYATVDGSRIEELVHPLTQPNGVGLSPDGSRVYVAETGPGRVWWWDIDAPGRLRQAAGALGPGGATLLHGFEGFQLLDSLAVDSEGDVCVATLVTGGISILGPDGGLKDVVQTPEYDVFVTNICFGGPDLRTAFITSSGRGKLYATRWHCPGLRLNFPV
ncbi:MAG: SMP-30/gluconolactonase/LRE family protein [Pseudonocardiaceae bacterium]|nr:SMP-30/gluconolactonase/LRE family protein [Pseudonocardiaceae bacterium]